MTAPHEPVLVLLEDEEIRGLIPASEVRPEDEWLDGSVVVVLEDQEMGCLSGLAPEADPECIPVVILEDGQWIDRDADEGTSGLEESDPVIVVHDNELSGLFN